MNAVRSHRMRWLAGALLALSGLAAGTAAAAQAEGQVIEDTALFAGPGEDYPVVEELDAGDTLVVLGCLEDYSWCDAVVAGQRGWVDGDLVNTYYEGDEVVLGEVVPLLGLPFVSFSFDDYWGRYYMGRPWYGDRWRWQRWDWRARDHRWDHPWVRDPRWRDRDRHDRDRYDRDGRDHDGWNGREHGNGNRDHDGWRDGDRGGHGNGDRGVAPDRALPDHRPPATPPARFPHDGNRFERGDRGAVPGWTPNGTPAWTPTPRTQNMPQRTLQAPLTPERAPEARAVSPPRALPPRTIEPRPAEPPHAVSPRTPEPRTAPAREGRAAPPARDHERDHDQR